jgi:hypothetical protein
VQLYGRNFRAERLLEAFQDVGMIRDGVVLGWRELYALDSEEERSTSRRPTP